MRVHPIIVKNQSPLVALASIRNLKKNKQKNMSLFASSPANLSYLSSIARKSHESPKTKKLSVARARAKHRGGILIYYRLAVRISARKAAPPWIKHSQKHTIFRRQNDGVRIPVSPPTGRESAACRRNGHFVR